MRCWLSTARHQRELGWALLLVLCLALPARGELLIRELFDGLTPSLNGAGDSSSSVGFEPGTVWVANRTDSIKVADNFNVDPAIGNQLPFRLTANGGIWWSAPSSSQWDTGWWATRQLASGAQINLAADGVYYFIYHMRRRNDSGVGFGFATGSAPTSQFLSVGATWNNTSFNPPANRKLAVARGTLNAGQGPYGANAHSTTQVNNDARNLILVKITASAGGADLVQAAFFNSSRAGFNVLPLEETNVVWDVTYEFTDDNLYTHLLAYMNGPTSSVELDAFRLSTSYPELVQRAPVVLTQPTPTPTNNVFTGNAFAMTVVAGGGIPEPFVYQWFKDGAALPDATNATLNVLAAALADAGDYYVVVSNNFGVATSLTNTIAVSTSPPIITVQPGPATRFLGSQVTLAPTVVGSAPFQFQWEHDGQPIAGATNASLMFPVTADSGGNYVLFVTNEFNWVNSEAAVLTVLTPAPGSFEEFIVTNQPIAYWRYNDSDPAVAFDHAGGHHAANTAVTYTPGMRPPDYPGFDSENLAGTFNGSSSGSATTASLMNNRSEFTILGWFNAAILPQPGSGNGRIALFGQNDAAEFGFHGSTQLGIWTPNGGFVAFDPATLVPNRWYLLAAVGTGTNMTVYINGAPVASGGNTTTNYGSSSSPFRIGMAVLDSTGNFFTGAIDEVAVFDRALPPEALNAAYAQAAGIVTPAITSPPRSQALYAGQTARFQVGASGTLPFVYDWFQNDIPLDDDGRITGSHAAELVIPNVTSADAGQYKVAVENPAGFDESEPVTLEIVDLPAPGTYGALVLSNAPFAHWSLNEPAGASTAFDYVGGYSGSYGAGATTGVPGPRAPEFPLFAQSNTAVQTSGGADSWVAVPNLNLQTDTATFAAWIYPQGDQGGWRGIVFSRAAGTIAGLHYGEGNELRYTWNDASTTWGWNSGLIIPTNQWSFVVLVITPTNGTLYLGNQGRLHSAVNEITNAVQGFAGPSYIGQDPVGGRVINGVIDEVVIFNRALTPGEIGRWFLAGLGQELTIRITPSAEVVSGSNPTSPVRDAFNAGATWLASDSDGTLSRTGVMQFTAAEGDQIRVPANPALNSPTGAITFWMRSAGTTGAGNDGALLVDRRTAAGDVIVLLDDGSIFIQPEWMYNASSTRKVNDNRWHHIAYVYDQASNAVVNVYIDGQLDISRENPRAWSWPALQPLELGRSHDPYWRAYEGLLDDVRVYNRQLSPTEVADLAAGGPNIGNDALQYQFTFDMPGGFLLDWQAGRLESSSVVTGPYEPVVGAFAPWPVSGGGAAQFFRAVIP